MINFVFFGGEPLATPVLEILKEHSLVPELIVCSEDKPVGRKQILTPPPVKTWAEEHGIPTYQPTTFTDSEARSPLTDKTYDLFVVVAYNAILPNWLISLPTHQTINLHPSLLPHYRGPSPIRTAILEDNKEAVGVSVLLLDEKMDHGPILGARAVSIAESQWPMAGPELDQLLAREGGLLLSKIIPKWCEGTIQSKEQKHELATYTKKFNKADSKINLDPFNLPTGDQARLTFAKIQALKGAPQTFFFHQGKRIKIVDAQLDSQGRLIITTVLPEGKKETPFSQWLDHQQLN